MCKGSEGWHQCTSSPDYCNDNPKEWRVNVPRGEIEWFVVKDQSQVQPQRILRLTLKRRWFDMIAAGEKKEEYRKIKKWILSRLQGKTYDAIEFANGYGQHVPKVTLRYLGWGTGTGRSDWGATPCEPCVIIRLGEIISKKGLIS